MKTLRFALTLAAFHVIASPAPAAAADERGHATFALVIGANRSVDADLAPLKYADDDAARYLDLFRLLGARTYLLARLDDNTRALHAQAAAEAQEPKRAPYDAAVAQLTRDVAQAAARNVETTVYVVYAGHGNVKDGQGYLSLEDARITGSDLARTFAALPATRIHLIADACASYFVAYSRGPGGTRRAVDALPAAAELSADPRVGLLLSSSSAKESHEWEAFQAGVFSHEVRSGLYGAADADRNGIVTYREIAAFVARANESVPNERYRPEVHSRAPRGGDALLDLRRASARRLEIGGKHAGHYTLEDARGVRLVDMHNAPNQTMVIVRPAPTQPVFLRRAGDDKEMLLPADLPVLTMDDLAAEDGRVASRGAAHESFSKLFALPFDVGVVDAYRERTGASTAALPDASLGARRTVGLGVMGVGALAAAVGVGLSASAASLAREVPDGASQADASAANERIASRNSWATVGYVGGGAALVTGALLFFWPKEGPVERIEARALPGGALLGIGDRF